MVPEKFGIGAAVRRKEDPALVTGNGRFVSDYLPEGTLHAFVLRSPYAHADFTIVDTAAAAAAAGVHLVLTAADIAGLGPLPCKAVLKQHDGSMPFVPARPVLADGRVRHIGEAIAFIVAESVDLAKSAAELVEVDWRPRAATVGMRAALDGAGAVWPERPDNVAFEYRLGDAAATAEAFARAATVAEIELVNNRVVTNYLEPRGVVAEYDRDTGRWTITVGSQGGHSMRGIIAGDILKVDPARMRVVTPDVGGGFGTKMFVFAEYPLAAVAAERLGRPVKWIGERGEHFLGDSQGRDNLATARLALDSDGRFLGLEIDLLADMGAYLAQFAPYIPFVGNTMATGLYDIPALSARIRGVYTNTVTVDAYRGAGRPEAAYLVERLVDRAAEVTGLPRDEIRRRNFVRPEQLPYRTQTGRTYDSGEFAGHLDRALEKAGWAGFAARREASAARQRYRGIGIASYVEAAAFPSAEEATARLEDDGSVTILIGTQSNGQGHQTAYAQIAAVHFGIDIDRINIVQGDTDLIAKGGGTGGSRSVPIGGVSVDRASTALVEKIRARAAEELETAPADLELVDGEVRIMGTDRAIALSALARATPDKSLLTAVESFKQPEPTYPNGSHVCELEVDPETGVVEILNYVIVDDFGVSVNPLLLAGQVHGGIVQGLGQALSERTVYDEDGQLLSASLLDYALPRAADMPSFDFETRNVPCKTNPLGIKGAGEAGTIGACPAVMNALADALKSGAGVSHIDMPATPERVWQAIRQAQQGT
ncbi:MAG: xanthine dehydrogenase family protein molybdopterin-binding subunit [Hyphomicrobiales bacterium]